MECRTPAQTTQEWTRTAAGKAAKPATRTLISSMFAGAIVAFGSVAATTATFSLSSPSATRLVAGLLFPFGLAIIILLGADLFTGNVLLAIPVLSKQLKARHMLRNLALVYTGNLAGGILIAAGTAFSGQMNLSQNQLAVYFIKTAVAKSSLPFGNAIILGILCNVLVCCGVLLAQSSKDITGKILGSYLPVCFFVIAGFEHCVANMYYIPAGIFALSNPQYAAAAAAAGINTAALSWPSFFAGNLLPVTIGNLLGGILVALYMWACHSHSYAKPNAQGDTA